MSLTTGPRRSSDRLPRPQAPGNRGAEIRLGLLGLLGILVLEVGIPFALVRFVGYPLPRSAPSRDWLTQSVSATLIIKILACIVWLVWAHFTVCVLSEWRALRRGRLPGSVPFGGGSQVLARRLVAAALLLAGAATTFGNLGPAGGGHAAAPATRPVAAQSAQSAQSAPSAGARPADKVSATARGAEPRATESGSTRGTHADKYYVVQPPHGRHYDCLWDIAQRTLGDPLRYKEIFALNKDRVQADGSRLVDANLIRPGWELRLPADATGPGVRVSHASAPARPAASTEHSAGSAATAAPARGSAADSALAPTAHGAGAGQHSAAGLASTDGSGTSMDTTLLGGGLMLAGIALALAARRGPYGERAAEEEALTLAADLGLAASLDRALRNLAAARREQGRALPFPVVAWASAEQISLNLAGGDTADPPAPWLADVDRRSWTCRLADVVDHRDLARTAAPFPGLISVGRADDYEVFVDFEQAPGLVSLGGDVDRCRDLATGLAVQAVTSAWSDGALATLVGFADGAELAALDRGITAVDRLDGVLDRLEQEQDRVRRLQRELGVDGVLNGRLARRSALWRPQLIVLSGQPNPDEVQRLQALVSGGRSPFVVIVVGDTQAARWRFVLDATGRIDLGVLGASARAHRLGRESIPALAEMLAAADRQRRDQDQAMSTVTPHQAAAVTSASTAPIGSARRALDAPASATVWLLGPVTVTAPGPIAPPRRELATEIAIALALHPDGMHEAVLRASIWPRGVGDDVFDATMADVVAWLGTGRDGRPCLERIDGAWRVSPAVRVDLDDLRQIAAAAAGPDELKTLLHGIDLFRGPAFSATPPRRYHWLAFSRAAREARVLVTAVTRRAAALLAEAGRAAEAEDVLRRGLQVVPGAEPIWRDLLNLVVPRGPEPTAAVADQMYTALAGLRIWPAPETDALVEQLVPGYTPSQSA
jgi:hypothetical protein